MPLSKFLCPQTAAVKRERRKEARPGELLDAALDLFVEKGFASTRVEEVAARAGVSKGTLFLYFPSKEELFKAVIRENISGRFAEWNAEFEAFPGTSAEMIAYCMKVWWERVGATKASGITKLIVSEGSNFPELATFYRQEVVEPGRSLIRRILRRGIDRGEFRQVDLDHAIFSIIAPMMFLILSRHASGVCIPTAGNVFNPLEYIDAQVDTLVHGLAKPRNPAA
ncbi:MAG: TetR/AcrR family transcriptional regulator [Comamonadaceae bacterium]|nr:MAG: TetR/AcrR family transcriptional regulator [Comamonadaceae bacterium]